MSKFYRYGFQCIDEDDISALCQGLRGELITNGPNVAAFEEAIARRCGAAHAVAVSCGSAALQLAAQGCGLGPGKRAWTSAMTFVGAANAIAATGAAPGFVDIDPHSFNVSPETFEAALIEAERRGETPDLFIPVHFAGQPCDMEGLAAVARRWRVAIIEDACHALGAAVNGLPVGGCHSGSAAACFSLHPVKSITTGEGGLILTNDDALAMRLRRMRNHGIGMQPTCPDEPWRREMTDIGFNHRMTEFQASLGLSQLSKLDTFLARRQALAALYRRAFAQWPVRFQQANASDRHAHHLLPVVFDFDALGVGKRALFDQAAARGIFLAVQYYPPPLHAYYRRQGFGDNQFPAAEDFYRRSFCLPIHPSLTEDDVADIHRHLGDAVAAAR